MIRLLITRHGKTTENESGIIQGRSLGQLSETGCRQAVLLGKRLCKEHIDIVFVSPSERCKKTLEIILSQFEIKPHVVVIDELQERDFGKLSGLKLESTHFELLENHSKESQEIGIESIEHLYVRTKDFIESLKERQQGKTVLVLTHSNNIRAMFMYFFSKTFIEALDVAKINNCAFTEFDINEQGSAHLVLLDDVSHLK